MSTVKGTSNCLAEFEKNPLKLPLNFFLNFLHDLRGILPEIDKNLPCSFPPGVSQTWWNLTIGFFGKHLTFFSKLNVDLLKNLIDMFMEYLCVHHVVK